MTANNEDMRETIQHLENEVRDIRNELALMKERGEDDAVLAELEEFLKPRIEAAEAGHISKRSVGEIFQQAYDEVETAALADLETLLDERLKDAVENGVSTRTVGEIFEEGYRRHGQIVSG